jgi:hypothetical protein
MLQLWGAGIVLYLKEKPLWILQKKGLLLLEPKLKVICERIW